MSVHVKAQCRAGCGELGDAELNYLCVDCHADRIEIRQQQELREYMAKESAAQKQTEPGVSSPPASPVKKYRGPRPIDHAKALESFLKIPREMNTAIVSRELTFLKREIAIRETSKKQLRKYMIATDAEEQVDPKEWGRYEYGPPKKILNRDIDEVTELAAQLKLFCHWRKRQIQQRIELRHQQVIAERKALKSKKSGLRSLPLAFLRGSSKTAVDHTTPQAAAKPGTASSSSVRRPLLLKTWKTKDDKYM